MLFGFPKWQVILVGIIAALLGLSAAGSAYHSHVVAEVTQQLIVARADTRAALTLAKHDSAEAVAQKQRGDSLLAVADSARKRAATSASFALRAKLNYDTIQVQDSCKKLKAAADSALSADSAVVAALQVSADSARKAAEQYRGALTVALSSLGSLSASTTHLDSAAAQVPKALKEPFWTRIAPKAGLGAAAGINPQGKFDAVVGLTLGWHF